MARFPRFWLKLFKHGSCQIGLRLARRIVQCRVVPFRNSDTKQLLFSVAAGSNARGGETGEDRHAATDCGNTQPEETLLAIQDSVTRLVQARNSMERNGVVPAGLLRPAIAESWRRCLANGLDPRKPPKPERMEDVALQRARDLHAKVRNLAIPEMQALHQQLGTSTYVLAFAGPDGVLLDSMMTAGLRTEIEGFGIVPGSLWNESRLGTNALGTAIASQARIDVRGAEHFFAEHNRLSCMTAPIFGPDRTLAGVLDASCNAALYVPHARASLALAAAQIEAHLFRVSHAGRVLVLHGRAEFLDTAYAGLLALDDADRVVAANEQARFMLAGLPEPAGTPLAALFAPGAPAFKPGVAGSMADRSGRIFRARLDGAEPAAARYAVPKQAHATAPVSDAVAEDAAVRAALDMASRAALRGLPVLIRGETGTGKEVVARAAHRASGRGGKFVAVNCAAIPPDLLAAELFGHAEGAFTGARRGGAKGLALEADGGTLFLDEIADLPAGVQAALLRFLDDFSIRPVGGAASRVVDILLLAATNENLATAVAAGKFRADLYYRLAITEVFLPRLAARTDFATLAEHLLRNIAPEAHLEEAALYQLQQHEWPGNIRELRNLLTKLVLSGATRITVETLETFLPMSEQQETTGSVLRDVQAREIAAAMRDCNGNISAAARKLGVSRNTIYRALGGG
jgi:transcriptional regulator of acetoin/glycerol metabolism